MEELTLNPVKREPSTHSLIRDIMGPTLRDNRGDTISAFSFNHNPDGGTYGNI